MCTELRDVSLPLVGKGAAKDGGREHSVPDLGHRGPSLPETDHIRIQKRKSHFVFLILIFFLIWSRNAMSNVTYESTEVHTNNSSRRI